LNVSGYGLHKNNLFIRYQYTMEKINKVGWIGIGRMGLPMVKKILEAGFKVTIWNRTRSKAAALAKYGAEIVDAPVDLATVDVLFTMVSTGLDLEQVYFGQKGVMTGKESPQILVDCSSIGADQSAALREKLNERNSQLLAAPVSGNGKCVKAGKLSSVVSGPKSAFDAVESIIKTYSIQGVSYVGEGELARFCKIAHNVLLAVYTQNMAEITILAEKAGIGKRVHPHGFRHSGAVRLLRAGADVAVISKALGHSNIATTDRYINHLHPQMVVDAMKEE